MGDRRTLSPPARLTAILTALAAGIGLAALYAPLLDPARALATRDIALFHLPLRVTLRWLASLGSPVWDPLIHGGQPLLSNPNYAAFYPPTWLILALPPERALSLQALFHAALAFTGAWLLARRLGCNTSSSALAALSTAGGGAFLSLLSSFNFFCGMAWLPWVLLAGDAAISPPVAGGRRGRREDGAQLSEPPGREGGALGGEFEHRPQRLPPPSPGGLRAVSILRPALLAGLFLAAQLLAGEPVAAMISGLALLAFAAARPTRLPRLLLIFAAAILLAAIQLLPTLGRLAGSPRAGGLGAAEATTWSAPPQRAVELLYPRFFGDPARDQEGLYFGWHLHDRGYPYVLSLYPGLLITVLALCALLRWPIPRRTAWILALLLGALLATGRHDPLYELLRRAVPPLALLRFPEKFALLAVAPLGFAAALGWHWLLAERRAGRPERADLPLALCLALAATAAALASLLHFDPPLAAWLVRAHGAPGLGPQQLAQGVASLHREGWTAFATALATALLFALCRLRRVPEGLLALAAVLLLALDLWHYGHGLVATLPAAEYRRPPELALVVSHVDPASAPAAPAALDPAGFRVFTAPPPSGKPEIFLRSAEPGRALVRTQLARLDPYAGAIWRISYAGNEDYDLMLTEPARRALDLLHLEWKQPQLAYRLLGAWNVGAVVVRRPAQEWIAEAAGAGPGRPARPLRPAKALANPYVQPRFRLLPRASFHPTVASALGAARAGLYQFDRDEQLVRPAGRPETVAYRGRPQLLEVADRGGRIAATYRSSTPAFFTAAVTFDRDWSAELDGHPLPTYQTGIDQLAVEVPAGDHRLTLTYRDPLVAWGALVSFGSLGSIFLGIVLLGPRAQRRRHRSEPVK